MGQKNSLKNWFTQSVIQLSSPARKQEVHQLHSRKRFPGMENQFSNLESPAGEMAQGDKKVGVHSRGMRTHVCIPASMLKLAVGTHTCSHSVGENRQKDLRGLLAAHPARKQKAPGWARDLVSSG